MRDDILMRMVEELVEMALRLAKGRAEGRDEAVHSAIDTALRLELGAGLYEIRTWDVALLLARVRREERLRVAWLLAEAADADREPTPLRRLARALLDGVEVAALPGVLRAVLGPVAEA